MNSAQISKPSFLPMLEIPRTPEKTKSIMTPLVSWIRKTDNWEIPRKIATFTVAFFLSLSVVGLIVVIPAAMEWHRQASIIVPPKPQASQVAAVSSRQPPPPNVQIQKSENPKRPTIEHQKPVIPADNANSKDRRFKPNLEFSESTKELALPTFRGKDSVPRDPSDGVAGDEGIATAIAEETNAADEGVTADRKLTEKANMAKQLQQSTQSDTGPQPSNNSEVKINAENPPEEKPHVTIALAIYRKTPTAIKWCEEPSPQINRPGFDTIPTLHSRIINDKTEEIPEPPANSQQPLLMPAEKVANRGAIPNKPITEEELLEMSPEELDKFFELSPENVDMSIEEFEEMSIIINNALLEIYREHPTIGTVVNGTIVQISNDIQNALYHSLMDAAEKSLVVSIDQVFSIVSGCLSPTVGGCAAKSLTSLFLNRYFLDGTLSFLNPANMIDPTKWIKWIHIPIKLILLEEIGMKMAADVEQTIDNCFNAQKAAVMKNLKDRMGAGENGIIGLGADCLEVGADCAYELLKNRGKEQLSIYSKLAFKEAHKLLKQKTREAAKAYKCVRYYHYSKNLANMLSCLSGTSSTFSPETSPVGYGIKKCILEPVNDCLDGVNKFVIVPFNKVKGKAWEVAGNVGKYAVNKTAAYAHKYPDSIAARCIDASYNFVVKQAANAIKGQVEPQIRTITTGISNSIITSVIPYNPNQEFDITAFQQQYLVKIDKDELKVAEWAFYNELEIIIDNYSKQAIEAVDRTMGQNLFNQAIALREYIYNKTGMSLEDQDGVRDITTLQRKFEADDDFDIEKSINDLRDILLSDLQDAGAKASLIIDEKFKSMDDQYTITKWVYWATGEIAKGVVNVAIPLGAAYYIESRIKTPFIEARNKFKNELLSVFITDMRSMICDNKVEQQLLEQYPNMNPMDPNYDRNKVATIYLQGTSQKMIETTNIFLLQNMLSIDEKTAKRYLAPLPPLPKLVEATESGMIGKAFGKVTNMASNLTGAAATAIINKLTENDDELSDSED